MTRLAQWQILITVATVIVTVGLCNARFACTSLQRIIAERAHEYPTPKQPGGFDSHLSRCLDGEPPAALDAVVPLIGTADVVVDKSADTPPRASAAEFVRTAFEPRSGRLILHMIQQLLI